MEAQRVDDDLGEERGFALGPAPQASCRRLAAALGLREPQARSPRPPWATPTLRRALSLGYAVSRATWEDSARDSSVPSDFRAHCVSHACCEDLCEKLHDHSRFQPHCVSHCVPPKSVFRWHHRRLSLRCQLGWFSDHTVLEPRAPFLVAFPVAPRLARATMSLALTLGSAAHLLSITGPRMRPEPDPRAGYTLRPPGNAAPSSDLRCAAVPGWS